MPTKHDMSLAGQTQKESGFRVVIENISPSFDGGRFPVKRVVGETVTVSADIFADGHDMVSARLQYRKKGLKKWQTLPLSFVDNDRWQTEFKLMETGLYEFTVSGWVDVFKTGQHNIIAKFKDGQVVEFELRVVADHLLAIAKKNHGSVASKLKSAAKKLTSGSLENRISALSDPELSNLVQQAISVEQIVFFSMVYLIRADRSKAGFSTWYEFFPRSFGPEPGIHGSFENCLGFLPGIAAMGFDVIYLPPIHPIGETCRKGKNNTVACEPGDPGSPWAIGSAIGGHTSLHPELGTMTDFKKFISETDKLGMEIAMDIAFQCSPDHPWIKEHPEWFFWLPDGSIQYAENPPKKYEDIVSINFQSTDWKGLWEELKNVIIFWISKGIRIFRVDNPHAKSFSFWEWLISTVQAIYPDVLFLAEAFTRPKVMYHLAMSGFSQSYTYFTWRFTKQDFIDYLNELTHSPVRDIFRPNFWPNTPDILSVFLQHQQPSAFEIRYLLAATLSANCGIYGPAFELCENIPLSDGEEYINSEKYEIKNRDLNKQGNIRKTIARINAIRHNHKALQSTYNLTFCDNDNEQVLSFVKVSEDGSSRLFIIISLDPEHIQSGWVKLPGHLLNVDVTKPFQVKDVLNEMAFTWEKEWNFFKLNPCRLPAHIFQVTQSISSRRCKP